LACDIWFGPGGLRGAFGAGLALQLEEFRNQGRISLRETRVFGSSVGCLNAVYLATGHAHCGMAIYEHDIHDLIHAENLLPSVRWRVANQFRRLSGRPDRCTLVPNVLNVDHVFRVMERRTPDVVEEIRRAATEVMAEVLEKSTGAVKHISLRHAEDPLATIHGSLNYFPLYCASTNGQLLDPAIRGYGFDQLLDSAGGRKLVVILNEDPRRRCARELLADVGFAALSANAHVSLLFLLRLNRKVRALRRLESQAESALLLCPDGSERTAGSRPLQHLYQQGRQQAIQLVKFVENPERS
jgi:hypothetical protein